MRTRMWTSAELRRASALWKDGKTSDDIAAALGRHVGSIKHQVRAHRDLFPRRHEVHQEAKVLPIKFTVSRFMHRTIKTEAKRRGVSQCMVIREALRDQLLRKGKVS